MFEGCKVETNPDPLADLFIQMNDPVINNVAIIPLVVAGEARGASKQLRTENLALAAFSYDYWNIVNVNFVGEA